MLFVWLVSEYCSCVATDILRIKVCSMRGGKRVGSVERGSKQQFQSSGERNETLYLRYAKATYRYIQIGVEDVSLRTTTCILGPHAYQVHMHLAMDYVSCSQPQAEQPTYHHS